MFFVASTGQLTRKQAEELAEEVEHSLPPMFNGHVAVDGFFVLSGFLIGRGLLAGSSLGCSGYIKFLLRRVFRICPVFYTTILIYCVAVSFLPTSSGGPAKCTFSSLLANLFFYQNTMPMTDVCLAYAWSLDVEAHFYVLAPLLFLLPLPSFLNGSCQFRLFLLLPFLLASLLLRFSRAQELEVDERVFSLTVLDMGDDYFGSTFYAGTPTRIFGPLLGLVGSFFVGDVVGGARYYRGDEGTIGENKKKTAAQRIMHVNGGGGSTSGDEKRQQNFYVEITWKTTLVGGFGLAALILSAAFSFFDLAGIIPSSGENVAFWVASARVIYSTLFMFGLVGLVSIEYVVREEVYMNVQGQSSSSSNPEIWEEEEDESEPYYRQNTDLIKKLWHPILTLLGSRPLWLAAQVSYPAFLLHPLLIILVYILAPFSRDDPVPGIAQLVMLLGVHAVSVFLGSFLMHVLVEHPFVRLGKKVEGLLFLPASGKGGDSEGGFGLDSRRGRGGGGGIMKSRGSVDYEQLSLFVDDDDDDDDKENGEDVVESNDSFEEAQL